MPVLDALQAKREPNASSLVFFYKPGKRGEVPGGGGQLGNHIARCAG